jgi:predicted CoA-substrate-specific enzyme activase
MTLPAESLGICLGASTIGIVRLRNKGPDLDLMWAKTQVHEGNPRRALRRMLETVEGLENARIAATGRKFRHHVALSTISEPEAVERAVSHILPDNHPYRVVISAGGETSMVYHLDRDNRIQGIYSGNKCASGTGEFFLQQLGRMDLSLEEVARMEAPEALHQVSGRCSVFCKSDCTHALNKGIPKAQVVAGLARMLAGKALELLRKLPKRSVMLIGGCSKNASMVRYLREEIEDLYIPDAAPWFEAMGAALWAMDNEVRPFEGVDHIFSSRKSSLSFLKPLSSFKHMVHFKHHPHGEAEPDDHTILGLDVGSTTTKGVVMRRRDKVLLAAEYLRTNGDPVGASRRVYESLANQIRVPIAIDGLGVTGSGRRIAGLHAMTDAVINEIIAHAAAAVHFDPEVDTIFEIGGQDAKYTFITNGVASDYAMNEACSAGTGSFLEESAKESLGLEVTEIGRTAIAAQCPPNFNDQCAAFIGSDIKRAAQEGIPVPDIVAGLVYSIAMNYANRVKGNRPVGRKVFMQGGVCYNEAIPAAMAALTGKEIVVPPDPGLMGAFGVALEVERRMDHGFLNPGDFHLHELACRGVAYLKPFKCAGGREGCDLGCEISRIEIGGQVFPFGGICNRYNNQFSNRKVDSRGLNLVAQRERRVFRDLAGTDPADTRPTVGLNRSFVMHTYFPFFNRFFSVLGFRTVLPDAPERDGIDQQEAAFCFPVELAHGYAANLLARQPDFLFLPHLKGTHGPEQDVIACSCVFVQGEPFYLPAAFPGFDDNRTLRPYLDFSKGIDRNMKALREVATRLGVDPRKVEPAAKTAWAEQESFESDLLEMGKEALAKLDDDPDLIGVVLLGRPYNSFATEANKGIPAKFASRGVIIIPFDMIPCAGEKLPPDHNMYWGAGRQILKAAQYVKRNSRLFATYITNFSCGPDSFLVGYFRDIMGRKPSLTLELDSHTADAGIETRIEAFLDIAHSYRQVEKPSPSSGGTNEFRPAVVEFRKGKGGIRTSSNEWAPLEDKRVRVIIPAMGRYGTPLMAKAFARRGVRAEALPPADEEVLRLGRGNSTCKECLPLQTTIGSLLHYLRHRAEGEITAYFMASTEGPCRFGQYHVFSKNLVVKHEFPDVAVLSLTTANGYAGLGDRFAMAAWRAIVVGDLFDEMYSTILAGAVDPEQGLAVLEREHHAMIQVMHRGWPTVSRQLARTAGNLARIPLKRPYDEIPKLSLIGEIYVRRDPISLQGIVERLAKHGFIVRTSQTSEWIKYVDWLAKQDIEGEKSFSFWVRYWVKRHLDRGVRRKLAASGLFFFEDADVGPVVQAGSRFISPRLTGEAILTVGAALHEILRPSCGILSIGPFGCMPSRLAESILSVKLTTVEKRALAAHNGHASWDALLEGDRKLPFLAIETDGNAFPQIIEARLEAFMLQAQRMHGLLLDRSSRDRSGVTSLPSVEHIGFQL